MTKANNFNRGSKKPKILVAPLDWGLGHATRCVPIINELLRLNCELIIVADKDIFLLLKKEFPSTVILRYKGYEIGYSKKKSDFFWKMIMQFPKIFLTIRDENRWLKQAIKEHQIDAVISDNRFGMYSKNIPCIYITHQLVIKTPNAFSGRIARKIHNHFIKKYTSCWVPDFKENGLAGELSHPKIIPSIVKYIGPLSRFEKIVSVEKIYDLLISISGPEPQRSIFENIVLDEVKNFKGNALLVRGLPAESEILKPENDSVKIVNHLSAADLNKALEQSEIVISRSGYTSVMDMIKLQKTTILVPTPGQTEQEYLAKYLFEKKYFYSVDQEDFSLINVLKNVKEFPFVSLDNSLEDYRKTIEEFVLSLKTGNFAPQ